MSNAVGEFLHKRDSNYHHSPEVERVYSYLRQYGEHIPNQPEDKIVAELGFLASKNYVDYGILTGNPESIGRQVEHLIVGTDDVSESYFDLQRRIAREELGLGDIVITQEQRRQLGEVVREDQRATLTMWAEYLSGEETNYPDWFKHYAFNSVAKLTEYDPAKEQFRRRSNGTAANFPDLSQEALAYVYDVLHKTHISEDNSEQAEALYDKAFLDLAQNGNFGKIYAYAYKEFASKRKEEGGTTEGSWKKYPKIEDEDMNTVKELTATLLGHGTTWCVAGESTAKSYLSKGDFYVYYSRDKDGRDTIPRIAISTQYGKVAEIRGVEPGQHMETAVTDIALAKLSKLPGGESYLETAKDMQRLTEIDKRHTAGLPIDPHDVFFLRQYTRTIRSFGYYRQDPRIKQLIQDRDPQSDFDLMLRTYGHKAFAETLLKAEKAELILANLDKFESGSVNQYALIKILAPPTQNSNTSLIAQYLDKFSPGVVNHANLMKRLIAANNVGAIVDNLDKFDPACVNHETLFDTICTSSPYLLKDSLDTFLQKLPHKKVVETLLSRAHYELVADKLDLFDAGSVELVPLALRLNMNVLGRNLDKFLDKIDGRRFAHALRENGAAAFVANNLLAFELSLDDKKLIAEDLLNSADPSPLAANLKSFGEGTVDHKLLINRLIMCRQAKVLCENLKSFKPDAYDILTLTQEIIVSDQATALFSGSFTAITKAIGDERLAAMLLESGNADVLNRYSFRFRRGSLNHDLLATAMIESGRGDLVIKNYSKFDLKTMDASDITLKLIERGEVHFISRKFRVVLSNIEHSKLIALLIKAGHRDMVANNLQKFDAGSVDCEALAGQLLEEGDVNLVSKNIGKFLTHIDNGLLADMLIKSGNGTVVATHFSKFEDGSIDEEALAKSLIQSARGAVLASTIDITTLDTSQQEIIILDLIRNGKTRLALSKLEQLAEGVVDSKSLAMELLAKGNEESVARMLNKLGPGSVDHRALAENLIKKGKAHVVVTHFDKFEDGALNHKRLADALIKQGDDEMIMKIIDKLEPGSVDFIALVRRLMDGFREDTVARDIKSITKKVKPETVAQALITSGGAYIVDKNIDTFLDKGDHTPFAEMLYEYGFGYIVENNIKKFNTNFVAEII